MWITTLFDKSFIQSLSVDQSVWFDRFFRSVVCPVFYVETLADLSKKPREDRTAETEVRIIADKFPEMHGSPCANHFNMAVGDILGVFKPPLDGRIPLSGGVSTLAKSRILRGRAPICRCLARGA
jgi:hypothetical protein